MEETQRCVTPNSSKRCNQSHSFNRSSWNPSTNVGSKLVLSTSPPVGSPMAMVKLAVRRDPYSPAARGGSPETRSCSPVGTPKSGVSTPRTAPCTPRRSGLAKKHGSRDQVGPPASLNAPITKQALELLSMQTPLGSDSPQVPGPPVPQPRTPTISESSFKVTHSPSRLSHSGTGESRLSDSCTHASVMESRRRAQASCVPRPPPSSRTETATSSCRRTVEAQLNGTSREERQLQALLQALDKPSQLDFTPLRCKFSVPAC